MRIGVCIALAGVALATIAAGPGAEREREAWSPAAAAGYLDSRMEWWLDWPRAARAHGTACVSCHTALPYALARPSLRRSLGETDPPPAEARLLDHVVTRVEGWKDMDPYYPDQTVGLPKTSESHGTEAVLNALILSTRDAETGRLSDATRLAFDRLWALQMKRGLLAGAWAWLDFGLEPWETSRATYFGAALAALAVGRAPEQYASSPSISEEVDLLRGYLRAGMSTESLFNRLVVLWASSEWPDLLSVASRESIVADAARAQNADGGWSIASLGDWGRSDDSSLGTESDGFATATALLAMRSGGVAPTAESFRRGLAWLEQDQDTETGAWSGTSINRDREPDSFASYFMSDAATAFAVMVLTGSD